jgi:hypothetical protein
MSLLKPERPIFQMGSSFDESSEREEDDEVFTSSDGKNKGAEENVQLLSNL